MTWTGKHFLAAVGLASAVALGGCAYDDGYYGGMSVGSGYYAGGYYDDYWGPGSYYPGYYNGWYNGFYYPGSGYYVYDRGGRRHRWNDGQRRYWEGRRDDRGTAWSGARQGDRGTWRGRWREGSANAAPPVVQNQDGARSSRRDWGARSTPDAGGRTRDWTPRARSDGDGGSRGDGARGDGRSWRR